MLMRNADHRAGGNQKLNARGETHPPREAYSPREMLLGQIVLMLLLVIAILLRSWST